MKNKRTILVLLLGLWCGGCSSVRPVTPNASPEAVALLKYIHGISGQHTLTGQHNYPDTKDTSTRQAAEAWGKTPAIFGQDFGFAKPGDKDAVAARPDIIAEVKRQYEKGSIIALCWHAVPPTADEPVTFRSRPGAAATTNLATVQGQLTDEQWNELITPGTKLNQHWCDQVDVIAGFLKQLRDAHIPVLWRPYHEMNGDWFWWGGKDPATFIKLWQQMFNYFTKTKGLDNLLWVYAPNHGDKTTAYYPGDRYVDLAGLDAYTDFIDTNHIKGYAEVAQIKKPFGFTEFGPHGPSNPPGDYDYLRFIQGVQKDFPRTVFFMSWNAKWSLARNTNTTELLNHPRIVNREDLPKGLAGSP